MVKTLVLASCLWSGCNHAAMTDGGQMSRLSFGNPIETLPSTLQGYALLGTGDFNRDGKVDVGALEARGLDVLLGRGDGTLQANGSYPAGTNECLVIADLDGDQIADAAACDAGREGLALIMGVGDGTFRPPLRVAVGLPPVSVAAGDFNDDGIADLAVGTLGDPSVSVILGLGAGGYAAPVRSGIGAGYAHAIAVADLDGDHRADLIVAACRGADAQGAVVSLLGDGTGSFRIRWTQPVGRVPKAVLAADFNRDGRVDAAALNDLDYSFTVLLGGGTGGFFRATTYFTGGRPSSLVTTDFDGDGLLDIASGGTSDGRIVVFLGQPGGDFALPQPFSVNANALAVDDFNNDGRPDFAATMNGFDLAIGVILNQPH